MASDASVNFNVDVNEALDSAFGSDGRNASFSDWVKRFDVANYWTQKNRKQDRRWMRNQFRYQKWLNKKQMVREDNQLRRQVKDAKAAGLHPLAVLGGAAGMTGGPTFNMTGGSSPDLPPMPDAPPPQSNGVGSGGSGLGALSVQLALKNKLDAETQAIVEDSEVARFNQKMKAVKEVAETKRILQETPAPVRPASKQSPQKVRVGPLEFVAGRGSAVSDLEDIYGESDLLGLVSLVNDYIQSTSLRPKIKGTERTERYRRIRDRLKQGKRVPSHDLQWYKSLGEK